MLVPVVVPVARVQPFVQQPVVVQMPLLVSPPLALCMAMPLLAVQPVLLLVLAVLQVLLLLLMLARLHGVDPSKAKGARMGHVVPVIQDTRAGCATERGGTHFAVRCRTVGGSGASRQPEKGD